MKSVTNLNRRELTELDFFKLCRREKIKIKEIPLRADIYGYYTNYKGKCFIIINSTLAPVRWLEVAFHELGHHYLHATVSQSSFFNSQNLFHKQEQEAQNFAVLALIPLSVLEVIEKEPDLVFNYPLHLIEQRVKLFRDYGI
jgi:Zn-dependent peptidase ImmA (M78 family)